MKDIKVAIVGVGDMGSHHCIGFDLLPGVEVTHICDPSPLNVQRTLEAMLTEHRPAVCADYRELLSHEEIDAVVISVPNYLHREVAVAFLEAGKHVFLEKPVAPTLEDCDAILAAAERSGKVLQIGLVYRYSNVYKRMAEVVKSGRLEDVMMMWCKEFRDPFPPSEWFYDAGKSGGALVEKDCHHFDIFNWMIGANPVRVFASGGQHVITKEKQHLITNSYTHYPPKLISNPTIVDHAWVTVDYDNGSKANLGLCMYLKPRNLLDDGPEIGLIGRNGTQMVVKNDKSIEIAGGEDMTRDRIEIDVVSDSIQGGHTGGQTQRSSFIECLRSGTKPFASGQVGRSALLVALAAEKSIREERYVYLDELNS